MTVDITFAEGLFCLFAESKHLLFYASFIIFELVEAGIHFSAIVLLHFIIALIHELFNHVRSPENLGFFFVRGHSFPSAVITIFLILFLRANGLDDACVLLVMVWEGKAEDVLNKVGGLKQIVGVLDDCSRYHFEFSFDLLQLMKVSVIVGDKNI